MPDIGRVGIFFLQELFIAQRVKSLISKVSDFCVSSLLWRWLPYDKSRPNNPKQKKRFQRTGSVCLQESYVDVYINDHANKHKNSVCFWKP